MRNKCLFTPFKSWFAGLFLLFSSILFSQTPGKLSGRVIDGEGNALAGANVLLDGTSQGAAADLDGYYSILNIRAGTYKIHFRSVGYQSRTVENVKINADQTTKLDATLQSQAVQTEEVIVVAKKPIVEVNQTSSVSSINKDEIANLPVQGLSEIVNLQAGVVDGHFRGGRIGEVQYQVDGVTVNNPYDNSSTLSLDRSVLQEVQVISGTFDAKYGQAMSGVVNAILKSGSDKFEWSTEFYGGDYFTTDKNRYPHNNSFNPITIQNYQMTLSGPTYLPQTTFFISGRRFLNSGYLFGERRFVPTDSNNFETRTFHPTGDGKLVPMQTYKEWSGQIKISNQSLSGVQIAYQANLNKIEKTSYNTFYILNPDGIKTNTTYSLTHGFGLTQTISNNMFYKLNLRQNIFDYKDMRYESLYDPRYYQAGEPKGDANYENGASVQGVDLGRFIQKTNALILKGDYTWQVSRANMIELGVEGQTSSIQFGPPGFIVSTFDSVTSKQILQPRENLPRTPGVQNYFPKQFAAYAQDKVEWGDLVLRAGFRFEYFDANAYVPSDFQNPANAITGAPKSVPQKTTKKYAVAPRIGFSFPLTDVSSIYFSYGHFYQMPGLGLLYSNADYSILDELQAGLDRYDVMGNPDLNPEKTVQYEFGFKQAIGNAFGLEMTFFYKDIRDLMGVQFIETYAAAKYSKFTNVDFGSVSGFTISLSQREISYLSTTLDYTLQFAQGNSSDPNESANRAASGKDSRPRDIAFGWDQRHTLNATAIWFVPQDYSIGAIIKYGSGQPYTPEIGTGFGADLETNSGRKSNFVLVDLRAEKYFTFLDVEMSLFARVFNLLNTHYANGFVFASTGSPDYSLNAAQNITQLLNPARFQEPRRIEFGISLRSK